MSNETEAATVAELARKAMSYASIQEENMPALLVFPAGGIKSLEAYGNAPKRKRAQVTLHEAKSFIAYVKAQAEAGFTALFGSASETGGSFNAIIDYHSTGLSVDGVPASQSGARWGDHNVQFNLQMTPEWLTWIGADDEFMSQEMFCEFIEDNMTDITTPDGASMLEMAQLIQGTKGVTFKSGKKLKNGAIDFGYTEEISTTGGRRDASMQIPDKFTLSLVPFIGALGVEMEARLRFNISANGQLSFKYLLNRPQKIIETAFNATRDLIESETKLPVLLGNAQMKNPT